jgi:hypothetical protein
MSPMYLLLLCSLPAAASGIEIVPCAVHGLADLPALRDILALGEPVVLQAAAASATSSAGGDAHRRLLPPESRMTMAISHDRGFYNSMVDADSPLGMSRVWPYMLEDVPWSSVGEIMAFQALSHTGQPKQKGRGRRKHKQRANSLPQGLPPYLTTLLKTREYTWYVNGQTNEDLWRAVQSSGGALATLAALLSELEQGALHPDNVNAWFSGGGTISNLHFDPSHNYICQLHGNKTIDLFGPDDSDSLYPVEFSGKGLRCAAAAALLRSLAAIQ